MGTLEFQEPIKGTPHGKWGLTPWTKPLISKSKWEQTPWTLYSLLKVFAFSDSAGALSRSQMPLIILWKHVVWMQISQRCSEYGKLLQPKKTRDAFELLCISKVLCCYHRLHAADGKQLEILIKSSFLETFAEIKCGTLMERRVMMETMTRS